MITTVSAASQAGGSAPNEDYFLVSHSWALVLDGVTRYPDDGCVHDVPWYVAHLGAALARQLARPDQELTQGLAEAIASVAALHQDSCDLSNPLTPAATVAIARERDGHLEWLVLGDCAVVWHGSDQRTHVESDDRLERLADPPAAVDVGGIHRYGPDYVATVRNRPGGYWVAAAESHAATQAFTGTAPLAADALVGLFSDGLTRLVQRYDYDWATLVRTGATDGMGRLLADLRAAEVAQSQSHRRAKIHDDATGVILHIKRPKATGGYTAASTPVVSAAPRAAGR
ncbi:protein phosphatase 2C domain-containing protein [Natronoglycomyces albus]|uniref:Protein phosphatase 2C domain-containing protein n=1 Tax=Natronoglycomyces albus TaxID=2811108 RepID=A0A895XQ15_9ACTN|nr:protein phosphatase 2C domain-containing protein [Natronoglycomyces albus]QSB05633.1 protein phosphatase 2C domain-containing protein [Natronoglycomyces albus]